MHKISFINRLIDHPWPHSRRYNLFCPSQALRKRFNFFIVGPRPRRFCTTFIKLTPKMRIYNTREKHLRERRSVFHISYFYPAVFPLRFPPEKTVIIRAMTKRTWVFPNRAWFSPIHHSRDNRFVRKNDTYEHFS